MSEPEILHCVQNDTILPVCHSERSEESPGSGIAGGQWPPLQQRRRRMQAGRSDDRPLRNCKACVGDDAGIVPHRTTRSRSKIVRSTCERMSAAGGRCSEMREGQRSQKIEETRKPEDFCGNRNPERIGGKAPTAVDRIPVDPEIARSLREAHQNVRNSASFPHFCARTEMGPSETKTAFDTYRLFPLRADLMIGPYLALPLGELSAQLTERAYLSHQTVPGGCLHPPPFFVPLLYVS